MKISIVMKSDDGASDVREFKSNADTITEAFGEFLIDFFSSHLNFSLHGDNIEMCEEDMDMWLEIQADILESVVVVGPVLFATDEGGEYIVTKVS